MRRKCDYVIKDWHAEGFLVYCDFDADFIAGIEGVQLALPGNNFVFVDIDPRYEKEDVREEIARQIRAAMLIGDDAEEAEGE